MCGRFTLRTPAKDLAAHFGLPDAPHLGPRYNVAPTQPIATVLTLTGDRQFRLMRWGLVPHWAKDLSIGSRMINARAETVGEKPAFRAALRHRRCLILADGFYEWAKGGKTKQPYYVLLEDDKPFAFAGLWERWLPPEGGEPVESCVIITTNANEVVGRFHDRMPVILESDDYELWLNPEVADPEQVLPLLKPFPAERMKAYAVSPAVNSPRQDRREFTKPLPGEP